MNKKANFIFYFLLFFILSIAPVVRATVIHVTTTQDNVTGSLREAISIANTNGEDDTIYIPTGTYILSGTADENLNLGGDLDIVTNYSIAIIGADIQTTIIDANQIDRALHVLKGTVSISGVTIQNGKTGDGKFGESKDGTPGAGIYNSGVLTLSDCIIQNNTCGNGSDGDDYWSGACGGNGGDGGGIYNNGQLNLKNCHIKKNSGGLSGDNIRECPSLKHGGYGGGIFNSITGKMIITGGSISENKSGRGTLGGDDSSAESFGGDGGGIYNEGTLDIVSCAVTSNFASPGSYDNYVMSGNGGGIYNNGNISMTGIKIQSNYTSNSGEDYIGRIAEGKGGGIFNNKTMTLTDCSISDNHTGFEGQGGGIYHKQGGMTLTRCVINGNKAGNGRDTSGFDGGGGGGIYSEDKLTLTNCAIYGNSAGKGGDELGRRGGKGGAGGGAYSSGSLTLINCAIINNYAGDAGNNNGAPGSGGGIFNDNGAVNVKNTIIANNQVYSNGKGPDFYGVIKSGGYNLIKDLSDCTMTGTVTGNITGIDPNLGPLADNGGLTKTCALLPGSPAIDAGNSSGITEDQRGYFKPFDNPGIPNISDGSDIGPYEAGASYIPPKISLSATQLNFASDTAGHSSNSQTFLISNSGHDELNWTASTNVDWLNITPSSGTDSTSVSVSIEHPGFSQGTYTASITITDPKADNSPQTVNVMLKVYDPVVVNLPFGSIDTPIDGATVYGSVPVTGWALDNIAIESVKIYRDPVEGEGSGLVYISNAAFVEGARPDVETAYPDYPSNYKAGWGYMLLTNSLPNLGNGTFTIYAKAADSEGNIVTLGTKTIHCDNAHAVKPFGAIDTPMEGGTISGDSYINFGWVLTPLYNTIPTDGSTIFVWVDGVPIGNPVYNQYREDIAALYPGYNNSNGAVGYYQFDTTKFKNGAHTISWSVKDNAGNEQGIGSRYFTIQNLNQSNPGSEANSNESNNDLNIAKILTGKGIASQKESLPIEIKELERVKINLPQGKNVEGYVIVGDRLKSLPIGSTLDKDKGVFYWQPGPGFIGAYDFIFAAKGKTGAITTKRVTVKINPKFK